MQIFSKKKKQKTSPSKDPQVKTMERRRRLEFQGKTDKGRIRKNNEDFFGFKMPEGKEKLHKYGSLFIVADGVGGSANGEVASQMAVSIISNLYYSQPEDLTPEARLQIAFDKANQTIRSKAQEMHTPDMATTATVAVVFPDRAIIANIGDSRCYVINPERTKNITQVTQDHSLVAEQVREGLITSQQAKVAKNKNVITRALGIEPRIKVDFFKLPIAPGDKILLTTDGLLRVLNDEQIFQVVQKKTVHNPVESLIELANKGGAPDNVTVCIIDVDKKVSFVKKNPFLTGGIVLFCLCVLAGYFIFASSWWENTSFHQDSINHRLSFSSPFAISLKLFLNDDMNTDISPQLEIRKKDNNKKIEIYKLREKVKKDALDFDNNDELTILIENEAKSFEPIMISLVYTIDKEKRIQWTAKDNKILIAEEERVLKNLAIKNKTLDLSDSFFWIPVKYLKIKAEGAEKVELFSKDKNLFGSNLEPPQYATDFEKKEANGDVNERLKIITLNKDVLSILCDSSTSPSVLTCYIHYPDAKYAFDLLYQGVNDGYQHEWSCNGEVTDITDPNQKKKVECISIDIQNGDEANPYYPTLIIQRLKGTVTFQVKEKTGKRSVSNANITIQQDGVNKGSAILKEGSASFTLFVGKYQYKIVDDGYKDIEGTFDVKANETISITKELEEKSKPPPATPSLIKTENITFKAADLNNQPLPGVTIKLKGNNYTPPPNSTDKNGEATFSSLPLGEYTYAASMEGYEGKEKTSGTITIKQGKNPSVEMRFYKKVNIIFIVKDKHTSLIIKNAKITIIGFNYFFTDNFGSVNINNLELNKYYDFFIEFEGYTSYVHFFYADSDKEIPIELEKN